MPIDPLADELRSMADDIQIGGDCNFRGMARACNRAAKAGTLTAAQRAHLRRLLKRANSLLAALSDFWADHPDLDAIADVGAAGPAYDRID